MSRRTQISGLEDHVGYWLRFVSNHVSYAFARKLLNEGITVSEWVALRCLYDLEECSQNELAQAMGMTKAPVSRILDRLVAKKLVHRSTSATDGRARLIRLTEEGHAIVPGLTRLADANDNDFFTCLSKKEQAAIVNLMRRVVAHHGLTQLPVD
ncbi:MAG TPA: MarR family transcriptional regulator [Acidobacteriaceae bacterium]|nr:MarR family transcriptional regulator [Acidobacteriaceae bacterium]